MGNVETEEEYMARREEEELILALTTQGSAARESHVALAAEYRAKLTALQQLAK